jgi:tetratricopeptide (TPR) repeat protein
MSKFFFFLTFISIHLAAGPYVYSQSVTNDHYAGRYTDGKNYAVYFEQTKYGLTIRPVLWSATQLLRRTGNDSFEVVDRTSRTASFLRDKNGRLTGVKLTGMDGEGLTLFRADRPLLPIELFLSDSTRQAAKGYVGRNEEGLTAALEAAQQVLNRLPTKTKNVVALLNELSPHFANDAKFHTLRGFAFVQAGDRRAALASFRRARQLEPDNKEILSGLARLGDKVPTPDRESWKLPFDLKDVFAKPTAAEISAVERDWASRDLSPAGIREETAGKATFGDWRANVRIVSHLVHGSRHYGAVVYPDNAKPGCCPVIVVAKGVSPTYFPLDIKANSAATFMGDLSNRFIFVFPSFRGEILNYEGKSYQSEGDRRDALDGATDDALALLNVALQTTPAADPKRICVYGHSRGGNVALLAGIRDRRIDCVVDLAGPTDWFYLMGTNGWTEEELWGEAVRTHANTLETGGQNLERFAMRAIEGKADLRAVRHNMIASSPLYFAKRLPRAQLHYGIEDPSVPVRNGYEFVRQLSRHRAQRSRYQAFFYPGQGHDTDRLAAPAAARSFIAGMLGVR